MLSGARPAVRGGRGLSRAAGRRELPAAAGRARGDREPDRRLAPGLQRHRAHLQQRDPDRARRRCSRACSASRSGSTSRSRKRPHGRRHASRSSRGRPRRALAALVLAGGKRPPSRSSSRGPTSRSRSSPTARSSSTRTSPSPSAAASPARSATSRCARASRSTTCSCSRAGGATGPARRRSSAAPAPRTRSASTRTTTGSASSGTTRRPRRQRTFRVHYRLRGVAVAYDDVVDVNLKVWGDEWEAALGQLTATLAAPGREQRAWGHPVSVRGDVTIDGNARPAPGDRRPGAASSSSCARHPALRSSPRRPG